MNGPIGGDGETCGSMTTDNVRPCGQVERDRSSATGSTPVSHHVITAVAEKRNQPAAELAPLYYAIDPDALNSVFSGPGGQTIDQLRFTYAGYHVTVNGDGSVDLVATEE